MTRRFGSFDADPEALRQLRETIERLRDLFPPPERMEAILKASKAATANLSGLEIPAPRAEEIQRQIEALRKTIGATPEQRMQFERMAQAMQNLAEGLARRDDEADDEG